MAIDLAGETILDLCDAAKSLPSLRGKRLHVSTLWRWAKVGCKGIKLDYVRIGHRIATSKEALTRFVNALAAAEAEPTPRPCDPNPTPKARTPERRARDIERARRELATA